MDIFSGEHYSAYYSFYVKGKQSHMRTEYILELVGGELKLLNRVPGSVGQQARFAEEEMQEKGGTQSITWDLPVPSSTYAA